MGNQKMTKKKTKKKSDRHKEGQKCFLKKSRFWFFFCFFLYIHSLKATVHFIERKK